MIDADDNEQPTELLCCQCRTPFWFTAGEQRFYASRGLATPRRCSECRAERRAAAGFGRHDYATRDMRQRG